MNISQKIVDYAIWYYLRYYPSTKKLIQKLEFKFGPDSEKGKKYGGINEEEIRYIIEDKLRNIIQEKEVCRAKIKNLIGKNKNIRYIKNNLRQKLFAAEMVEEILQGEFSSDEQSLLNPEKLRKKIVDLQRKGKSIGYIKNKFVERDIDKEVVEGLIGEIFLQGDTVNLQQEYEKIREKYEKQKIIEKLLRKGFYYGDIKQLFDARL